MKLGGPEVGEELRARRLRLGFTLRRGAEVLGVTMTELSYIEQGRRGISFEEFERISAVLRLAAGERAAP